MYACTYDYEETSRPSFHTRRYSASSASSRSCASISFMELSDSRRLARVRVARPLCCRGGAPCPCPPPRGSPSRGGRTGRCTCAEAGGGAVGEDGDVANRDQGRRRWCTGEHRARPSGITPPPPAGPLPLLNGHRSGDMYLFHVIV
jgi:hypothetical protein